VGVALEEEERPRSVAGPGRAGRSAQVPAEGNPPSCPGWGGFPAHSPLLLWAQLLRTVAAAWRWQGRRQSSKGSGLGHGELQETTHRARHQHQGLAQHSRPRNLLSWSPGRSWLSGAGHPLISSKGRLVTIRL